MSGDKCDKPQGVFLHIKSNKKVPLNPSLIHNNKGDILVFVFFR